MKPKSRKKQPTVRLHPNEGGFTFTSVEVPVNSLLLDPNNYRFLDNPGYKPKIKTKFHLPAVQEATLRLLERDKRYQISELKKSILTNGYVPMERVIIIPYEYAENRYVVVEGNRRVAALKSLIEENKEGVIDLSLAERKSFSTIPCAVLHASDLGHAARVIMGIRHIAGPKEWGAYQQAQLILEMHEKEGADFSSIGDHLGISTMAVARRYRAMRALKVMERDELFAENAAPEFYRLFHELVALPDVRARFGWNDETDSFSDAEKAREFFELIAPSDENVDPKIKTYSDVRKLKLIVGRPKAEVCLFDPDSSFADCLTVAEVEMTSESGEPVSVGQTCREAMAQLKKVDLSQANQVTATDVTALDRLLTLLGKIKQTVGKVRSVNR